MERKMDYGLSTFIKILELQKYKNKEEVLETAMKMLKIAMSKKDCSKQVIDAIKDATARINSLDFDDILGVIEISKNFDKKRKLKKDVT